MLMKQNFAQLFSLIACLKFLMQLEWWLHFVTRKSDFSEGI
jgi:hypothetical protein